MDALTDPPAYHATITDYDGSVRVRSYTAAEADTLIESHLFDEDEVSPAPDRSGMIAIRRTIQGPRSALDATLARKTMTINMRPAHIPRLTNRQYEDLDIVRSSEGRTCGAIMVAGRINAGFLALSPTVTRRLLSRGWLTLEARRQNGKAIQRVTLSYAGRIAMALREHRTSGNGVVDFNPDWHEHYGHSVYVASCSCGWRGPGSCLDPTISRRHARSHREQQLQAALACPA